MSFPPGSEIVISSVTIPEMARIIELNGLKCVPVSVDPNTLSPDVDELRRAIGPRTRGILVAHLFGVRLDLSEIASIARRHGLWLVEDCAQAFAGPEWTGSLEADASLFSFGPIKTQTALGGALVRVRDSQTRERMAAILEAYPIVRRLQFTWRALKYGLFKLLITRWAYSLVRWWCSWRGRDLDQLVRQSVRNFPAHELLRSIRRRPAKGMVRLLARRIRRFRSDGLRRRVACARRLQSRLQSHITILGASDANNVWWVFPVIGIDSDGLVAALRAAGFDASRSHSLTIVRPSADDAILAADTCDDWLSRTVFLPCYREMPPSEIDRLADVVLATLAARSTTRRHIVAASATSLPVRAS
jgi:dTDP-4-amino-4,6-dideoxygalactose transaminase